MIISDTGAFVALFNQRDQYHSTVRHAFGRSSEKLVTTYPVISETCYLLRERTNQSIERAFLKSMVSEIAHVFPLQNNHLARMIALMKKYEDLPMDFADASLVVLDEELNDGRILTLDRRDFSIYRWRDARVFQNLLLPNLMISDTAVASDCTVWRVERGIGRQKYESNGQSIL